MDAEIQTTKSINKRKKIEKFIIDETLIKTGSKYVWLWVAIEPMNKQILHCDMSFERTMLIVAERFIVASLINNFGKQLFQHQTTLWSMVSTSNMPVFESRSPYLFSIGEKRDRKNIAICKDRTIEGFDDYFPCKKNECKLKHVRQWFYLFINQHNREVLP
jgi:putative transposase